MYTENIIAIAKRENNTKRKFLVVNKEQGKHVPVSPDRPLRMFSALADLTAERYKGERLLLIGFAETATAIGEALAVLLDADYMQTTREHIPDVDYLYFSESHSHAAQQKVVKNDLDLVIDRIDRIVFVEDEVTTGNTIGKIVRLIRLTYGRKLNFSAVSLLNGMDEEARERYRKEQIELAYLVKTDHSGYSEKAEKYKGDGEYHECMAAEREKIPVLGGVNAEKIEELKVLGYINARRLHRGREYQSACQALLQTLRDKIPFGKDRDILVLGTEEFMYAPLYVAERIREMGNRVKFHATTRSPIMVSGEPEYPLHERYELASFYDRKRATYVYDLDVYDLALIITDAEREELPAECNLNLEREELPAECNLSLEGEELPAECNLSLEREELSVKCNLGEAEENVPIKRGLGAGAASLCSALCSRGNGEIYLVRWCKD